MIGGIYSGLSAMQAIHKKVDSTANNVANINTDEFKKTKVSLREGNPYGPVAEVRKDTSPGPMVYEQTKEGQKLVEKSNVELAEEIPNLMLSQRTYQANMKTIQIQDEMLGYLLDVKG